MSPSVGYIAASFLLKQMVAPSRSCSEANHTRSTWNHCRDIRDSLGGTCDAGWEFNTSCCRAATQLSSDVPWSNETKGSQRLRMAQVTDGSGRLGNNLAFILRSWVANLCSSERAFWAPGEATYGGRVV